MWGAIAGAVITNVISNVYGSDKSKAAAGKPQEKGDIPENLLSRRTKRAFAPTSYNGQQRRAGQQAGSPALRDVGMASPEAAWWGRIMKSSIQEARGSTFKGVI
jgi:hypothetical protein